MHIVNGMPGEHISQSAARVCAEAAKKGQARLIFNDIPLEVVSGDTPDKICRAYDDAMLAAHVAYLNSPEKIRDDAMRDAEIARLQERHDTLMRDLEALDWSSDVAVLDWLCAMQEPSDHVGVASRHGDILRAFECHGFKSNVNIGKHYDAEDRDNSFRYIVGQALATMKTCAIHGMVIEFTNRWKAKFIDQPTQGSGA